MVIYKDKYGRTDPTGEGFVAGVTTLTDQLSGQTTLAGQTPLGTVRTENQRYTDAGLSMVERAKRKRENDAINKANANKTRNVTERAGGGDGYNLDPNTGYYYKYGVYYTKSPNGTYTRVSADKLAEKGIQEEATNQDTMFTADGTKKSAEQIAAESMGLEYVSPEEQKKRDLEEMNITNKLDQKLLDRDRAAAKKQAEAARSTAEALAGTRAEGVSSQSINMLGSARMAQASRQMLQDNEELASRQNQLEAIKQAQKEGRIAAGSLEVQAAQAAVAEQQLAMDNKRIELEDEAYAKAQTELATIAGSEEFMNMSEEEQQAAIDAYSNLPENLRNSIASNAQKAFADKDTAALIAGTESAASTIASQIMAEAPLSYSSMQALAKTSFFSADQISGYFTQAQSIRSDKTLSAEEKEKQISALVDKINGTAQEKSTEEINWDLWSKMSDREKQEYSILKGRSVDQMEYLFGEQSSTMGTIGTTTTSDGITSGMEGNTFFVDVPTEYENGMGTVTKKEGWRECGEFVNDTVGWVVGNTDKLTKAKASGITAETAQPGDLFVVDTADENDHIGIIQSINEDGTFNVIEANWGKDGKIATRNVDPSSIYGYIGNPNRKTKDNLTPEDSEYTQSILIARLGKSIYGTKISDKESERVEGFVTLGLAAGKSEYEIMDDVLGYQINNDDDKEFSDSLRNVLLTIPSENGLADKDMVGFARLINTGNRVGAITKLENLVNQTARVDSPDEYITETNARTAVSKVNEIEDLITQLESTGDNPIGEFSGTWEEWLGRFKGAEAQEIASKVSNLTKDFTNKFLGSNMTEGEIVFYEPLLPKLGDKVGNFNTKLNELKSDTMMRINSLRKTYNLPTLNDTTLLDKEARVSLYDIKSSDSLLQEPLPESYKTEESKAKTNTEFFND